MGRHEGVRGHRRRKFHPQRRCRTRRFPRRTRAQTGCWRSIRTVISTTCWASNICARPTAFPSPSRARTPSCWTPMRWDSTVYGVKINAMPTIDIDLDKVEEVKFGHTVLRVIRTPGHTPGHVSLYEPESKSLFTGDTLFRESTDARICRAATIRGSCVRSWTTCSRWATKCASIPDTALKPPSATKCSTIPSSPKSSTRR